MTADTEVAVCKTGANVLPRQDSSSAVAHDSQHDSQFDGRLQTNANLYGVAMSIIELERTAANVYGRQARGLQNCLRGAVEASWVGSIPIHPRQIWPRPVRGLAGISMDFRERSGL
jgi:hypothetical protein